MSGSQVDNPSSGRGCQAARLTTRPLAKASSPLGLSGSLGKTRSRTLVIKSVVTESNATCPQRGLVAERRQRRSVAILVQAHAFVLAEGDGPRPLCMVPRAQPSYVCWAEDEVGPWSGDARGATLWPSGTFRGDERSMEADSRRAEISACRAWFEADSRLRCA